MLVSVAERFDGLSSIGSRKSGEQSAREPQTMHLGPLQLMLLATGCITQLPQPAATGARREKTLSILFQLSGRSRFEQLGNRVALLPGDSTLCDDDAPHVIAAEADGEMLVLRAPARMMREHLPSPEYFCARAIRQDEGMSAPITAMALTLVRGTNPVWGEVHRQRVARHLLDLVATSYAIAFDALAANSSIINGRQASAKLYIEQHLRDPDLTPCSIAERLKLSSRYLRLIFAAGNETVSAYILRRRLEECAKQIADPRWRGHSMTEIAFAWGFNSAPHFTRSFRDRFDMSPRDYRRTGGQGVAPIELRAAA